ncbi:hypothetical protein AVEN_115462-1 [Araneus ventricosus]|uniref:Uncharacterized protein n=1 Tax=Araneus ventricosus TaxID=182803 RepID=A0A4Y2P7G0_ARAVE|nr:hypothetical protein AVEN_115462-1 [Araneus ventricosus]
MKSPVLDITSLCSSEILNKTQFFVHPNSSSSDYFPYQWSLDTAANCNQPLLGRYSPQLYRSDSRCNSVSYYRFFTKLMSMGMSRGVRFILIQLRGPPNIPGRHNMDG